MGYLPLLAPLSPYFLSPFSAANVGTELALNFSSPVSDLNSNLVGALFSQGGAAGNIAEWSRPIGGAGYKSSMGGVERHVFVRGAAENTVQLTKDLRLGAGCRRSL